MKLFKKCISIILSITIISSLVMPISANTPIKYDSEAGVIAEAFVANEIHRNMLSESISIPSDIFSDFHGWIMENAPLTKQTNDFIEFLGEGTNYDALYEQVVEEGKEFYSISNDYARRLNILDDISREDGIADDKMSVVYYYISHFIDRKGGPYDPVNNPLDDPHLARYLVRNDIANYDLFLNNIDMIDFSGYLLNAISAIYDIKKLVTEGYLAQGNFDKDYLTLFALDKTLGGMITHFVGKAYEYGQFSTDELFNFYTESIKTIIELINDRAINEESTKNIIDEMNVFYKAQGIDKKTAKELTTNALAYLVKASEYRDFMDKVELRSAADLAREVFTFYWYTLNKDPAYAMNILERANYVSLVQTLSMRMGYRFYLWLYGEDYS